MCENYGRRIKTEALIATAEAYFMRGEWLQYDQLSMDRVVRVSPRREAFAPPEAASSSRTLHLDCSSFVWAVYYQTFGHMLEADLTWHMTDLLRPEVFYYEPTHCETPETLTGLKNRLCGLLEPGDIITYFETTGVGHTMLYFGNGRIINCSGYGVMSDYDYNECHGNYKKGHGAVYIEDLKTLVDGPDISPASSIHPTIAMGGNGPVELEPNFRNYLFSNVIQRFSVHRPLDIVGEPLPDAMKRIDDTRRLVCSAEPEIPAGRTADFEKPFRYTVTVTNRRDNFNADTSGRDVEIRFNGKTDRVTLGTGGTVRFTFDVGLPSKLSPPKVTVNGMNVFCRDVYCGRVLSPDEVDTVTAVARYALSSADAGTAFSGASEALLSSSLAVYTSIGACMDTFSMNPDCRGIMTRLFFRHDTLCGDVLSLRPENSRNCGIAPGLYGGKGVISPSAAYSYVERTRDLRINAFMPGDIILTCDDALLKDCRCCCFTGSSFIGEFKPGCGIEERSEASAERFVESLFGRFVFVVLRPSITCNTYKCIQKQNENTIKAQ